MIIKWTTALPALKRDTRRRLRMNEYGRVNKHDKHIQYRTGIWNCGKLPASNSPQRTK